jgi:hypothetical protein
VEPLTTKEISDRIIARIDDDATTPRSITPDPNSPVPDEVLRAINEGQELAAWLTLCLEKTAALTLTATSTFYLLRSSFPDFLVPLRLMAGGVRVRPATLSDLDALNPTWQSWPLVAGTQQRYFTQGFSFFGIAPQPVDDTAAAFTYAKAPALLVGDSFLEIPQAYHQAIVDYGVYRVKLKEGAQSLERGIKHLNRFLDEMEKLGSFIRARSRAAKFDTLPFELQLFDRSRIVENIQKQQAKNQALRK